MSGLIPNQLRLNLEEAPAASCFRTRTVSFMNQAVPVQAGQSFTIYPDAALEATVMDTSTAYLRADLEITNACYCADYANFGPAGAWGAIIQKWQTFNQGAQLENIEEYGCAINLFKVLEGAYDEKSSFYFSNKLSVGYQEEFHRQFVKPPMCDEGGRIMFGLNQFGLGFDATQVRQGQYANQYNSASSSKGAGTLQGSAGNPTAYQLSNTINVASLAAFAGGRSFLSANNAYGIPSASIPSVFSGSALAAGGTTSMDWPDYFDPSQSEVVYAYAREFGTINKPQITQNLCNVKCYPIGMKPAVNAYGTGTYGTVSASTLTTASNPNGIWSSTGATTIAASTTTGGAVTNSVRWRICARPLSGMLGFLADKWFLTMLLTPNQFNIKIETAPARIAFQVSSDPCRRIVGTVRDYIRNIGQANGRYYGDQTFPAAIVNNDYNQYSTDSAFAPGYMPIISLPLAGAATSTDSYIKPYINSTFSSGISCGRFLVQSGYDEIARLAGQNLSAAASFQVGVYTITCTANFTTDPTLGATYRNASSTVVYTVISATNTGTTVTITGTTAPVADQVLTRIHGTGDNTITIATGGVVQDIAPPSLTSTGLGSVLIPTNPSPPEYMLALHPWLYHSINDIAGTTPVWYANERQAFYGTRLKSSVPQTRRIYDLLYTGDAASSPSNQMALISYRLWDVAWVADQVSFTDAVAVNVLRSAAEGKYDVSTLTVTTTPLNVSSGSTTQNIVCPLTANEARKMYVIFQDMRQINQESAIYYDSFCGLNPFAVIEPSLTSGNAVSQISGFQYPWTSAAPTGEATAPSAATIYGVGYNLPLRYVPTPADPSSSTTFSVQLQIGVTNYPNQPLTTISEIIAELVKSYEKFESNFYSPNLYAKASLMDLGTGSSLGCAMYFDCLQDSKFTTAFVPVDVLDDQTITSNYNMVPLYAQTQNTAAWNLAGAAGACGPGAANATSVSSLNGHNWMCPRGFCTQGLFVSPSSTFMLGFSFAMINMSSGLNSYTYLGNQTITLKLTGAVGLAASGATYRGLAVVLQNAKYRYGAGGNIIFVK